MTSRRDLKIAQALLKKQQDHAKIAVKGYRSIVTPRQSDVWALSDNIRTRKLLKHPAVREALREIGTDPKALNQKYADQPTVRAALRALVSRVDPSFK
jgi:hypothetical protein